MATRVHDWARAKPHQGGPLTNFVVDRATPPALADLVRQVEPMRHSYIGLGPSPGRSSPDASFVHLRACVPAVIIEVSYSQKKKDLKWLARDYIIHARGDVRVVVGIDVDYRRTKMWVVSVWRAERRDLPDDHLHLAVRRVVTDQVSIRRWPVFSWPVSLSRRSFYATTDSHTGTKPARSCLAPSPSPGRLPSVRPSGERCR